MLLSHKGWKFRTKIENCLTYKRSWKIGRCIIRINRKKRKNWYNVLMLTALTLVWNQSNEKPKRNFTKKIRIVWKLIKTISFKT